MDIANWLRGLGLGQYEATFRDNAIEPDILADLTEADFEKLGISLGHRKRLLKAIAALDQLPATPAPQPVSDAAERRQVTVMFCDLVGSTAMSTQLEPEDMRSVIGAYHRCCGKLVEAHGGFSTWATASSPISVIRTPTNTTRSAASKPGSRW
jgi:class 3 adenylate cyclase